MAKSNTLQLGHHCHSLCKRAGYPTGLACIDRTWAGTDAFAVVSQIFCQEPNRTTVEYNTNQHSESGQNKLLHFGTSSMQGWRVSMEDAHAAVLDVIKTARDGTQQDVNTEPQNSLENISFFGVYDGHGGDKTAIFTGDNLHKLIARQNSFPKDLVQALKDGFLSADHALLKEGLLDSSGCAATTALVTGDSAAGTLKKIIVANAGDSRTILGVKGIAKPLSFDHKPQNAGESVRIRAAGGYVEVGRVNGNLALSRAIGDFDFKRSAELPPEEQIVTAYPDVIEHEITADDEFLILACDGIWDCMHSQEVVEFVRRGVVADHSLELICENLMDHCLAPASDVSGVGCDNMTVMIVALLNGKSKEEWYAMIKERVNNGIGPVAPESSAELVGDKFHEENQGSALRRGDDGEEDDEGDMSTGAVKLADPELKEYLERLVANGACIVQGSESNSASLLSNYFGLNLTGSKEGQLENEDDEHEIRTVTEEVDEEEEEEQKPASS